MITQFVLTLRSVPGHPLYADSAYRLYAHLLEQLPQEAAHGLHEAGARGISQHLQYQKTEGVYLWTVNILDDDVKSLLRPVLDGLEQVSIEQQVFPIVSRESRQVTLESLLAHGVTTNRATIFFCTPTAFRQNGRYAIYPQERLILQSLMLRWNDAFPMCPLRDEDAFNAMLAGIHIVDYQLRTSRFFLKGVRIPGFIGHCTLEAKLAPPLLEIWNTLLSFAEYAGIGIKTGIGMGGVRTTSLSR